MHNSCSRKKEIIKNASPRYVMLYAQCAIRPSYMCNALCLNRNGEMRALQRESQFLLGEGQVVVRLNRVVCSGQLLVWSMAKVASVRILSHGTRAREWVTVVRVYAGHAD